MSVLFLSCLASSTALPQEQLKAPEISSKAWFNAGRYKKIGVKELRGKVIFVFFWTSGDPHCETAVSILNDWYSRYKDKGLEIIGVYAPAWFFEGAASDVYARADSLGIKFPVVIDEDSAIRAAYDQQMTPSCYLIDRGGYIRARFVAVFSYRDMEKMLQTLLEEGPIDAKVRRDSRL